ncbi:hypothetical protein A6V39_01545 [Candidatus Mycoplasma haematobovis]|uniref:Uridine phosphorylase n=1 Tax=Candidatus Mycoplasma haematobovis TaxID=432608 RepID=A0A1A9QG91_9MOLU|nr:purine-nucleoside phosphorylase [Candidatus Mycoplasma haematobovis]OAL10730.1 hypothetical protein A6V39_01545 [Candidatus Mycoplasma haematobovis]
MSTPTSHISAHKDEIAKIVLMPGDPLRAKWAADKFLQDVKCVSNVRGMSVYTGNYNGKPVTIMGSGMGIPSMGIYAYELFNFYDVDIIIRVGSTGALRPEVNVMDVILVKEAFVQSSIYNQIMNGSDEQVLKASPEVVEMLEKSASKQGIPLIKERCFTREVHYYKKTAQELVDMTGAGCVEMESYALFATAMHTGKKAASLLTVVDSLVTGKKISAQERETTLDKMFQVALGIL